MNESENEGRTHRFTSSAGVSREIDLAPGMETVGVTSVAGFRWRSLAEAFVGGVDIKGGAVVYPLCGFEGEFRTRIPITSREPLANAAGSPS
jgi:hypothetical protein